MRWLLPILLAATAAAQMANKPVSSPCRVVTQEDAVSILGPLATKHENPGSCAFDAPGKTVVFVVIVDSSPSVKQQIQLPKQAVPRAGGSVSDEPSVMQGAYSTVIKNAQSIYFLKGNTGVSVSVTNDGGPLADQRDKLRPIAKRIAARL